MEEEYDYLTIKQEIVDLQEAMRLFMVENDVAHVFRDNYKLTLVRRSSLSWNADKLKALVPKGIWLKITKQVVDADKIDDLVRSKDLDLAAISPALTEKPQKPHIRRYEYTEGQDKDAAVKEEQALRQAMSQEAVVASGSKRKKATI